MPITRHHSGRWLYQFDRVVHGQRLRSNKLLPEGTTRAQALDYDQREGARLFQIATGGKQSEPLIEQAVLSYLTRHAPSLKNHADIQGALEILLPFYAGRLMSALPDVAKDYIAKAKGVKPATIRNRLAYLRAACRWAWKHEGMGAHDPAERMVLPKVKNARNVYLSRQDMLRIARAMGLSWARDVARVAFYTGMRAGEVLRSTRLDVGDILALSVADTKNGQPRIVPVHPRVAHLVKGTWPPPVTVWTASKATKKAMRTVGLGHARLHDLRHSAASEMVNAGVDLYAVGKVLGHKSAVSTARYAHLATATLQGAVLKIGAKRPQPEPKVKVA
jgi:integrase